LDLAITQPPELVFELVKSKIDADVEQVTIGIDFRWQRPFLALKFARDGFFQAFEIPAPKNETARGDEKQSNE
jgi:hypothetical protein